MDSFISTQTLGIIVVLVAAGFVVLFPRRKKVESSHFRGRRLASPKQGGPLTQGAGKSGLLIGRTFLPANSAYSHVAVVGATGSGKTIIQRLLMQSTLPLIGRGLGHRALVYDAKQDVLSVLSGMRLPCPVHVLNPMDARSLAWDMAADITCPASALQAATALIPEAKNDSNPFFSAAARHLLYGAIVGSILTRDRDWNFSELLLTMRNPVRLRSLLESTTTTDFLTQYFEHPATFQNILSTVLTHLCPFEVIAAAWQKSTNRICLTNWIQNESVLVLGNDEANRTSIDAMNRLIFRRLSELILTQPELRSEESRRTWLFLDEVREAGRLEGLPRLLTKGRSKGAAVVLGFQDIAGLREVYGQNVADEIVGQCSTKVFLRLNSPETAAWASRVIGSREVIEGNRGSSKDLRFSVSTLGRNSESVSHSVATRPLVLESEFFGLPETNPKNGLTGFFLNPVTGVFRDEIPGSWISENLLPISMETTNFLPRPVSDQYLQGNGSPKTLADCNFA